MTYQPPGVTITEDVTPQITSSLATPAEPCLVGLSQGFMTRTDQILLSGTTPIPLPGVSSTDSQLLDVLRVLDAFDPSKGADDRSGYVEDSDFVISIPNKTISRKDGGSLLDNTVVNITYEYTPAGYYDPIRLYDLATVEQRFGSAWNEDYTGVNSRLSFAASIVFQNGASDIILQPLFKLSDPVNDESVKIQPNLTESAATTTWVSTLRSLRTLDLVNLIVPIIGQSDPSVGDSNIVAIYQTVLDHVAFMQNMSQYIVAIFGEDSTGGNTVAQAQTLRDHATQLAGLYSGRVAEQTVMVSPSKFGKYSPGFSGVPIPVGGQYMAAAIMGMVASRAVSQSLTRKIVSGFSSVLDRRTENEKNLDATAGLLVVEQVENLQRVRHSITLDKTAVARKELSVVRGKHRMIESIVDTLDSQLIGTLIADDNAVPTVEATVSAVLDGLRQARDIVDYAGVSGRLLLLDPTTIEVRFSYRPAFPINYINIVFSIDLSSGTVNATPGA